MKKFFKNYVVIIGLYVAVAVPLTIWGWVTKFGNTVAERVVFENSFQYKEGMAQRAAILQANIAEIDIALSSGSGDREELLGQKRALKAQLNAITIQ